MIYHRILTIVPCATVSKLLFVYHGIQLGK